MGKITVEVKINTFGTMKHPIALILFFNFGASEEILMKLNAVTF